MSTKDASASGQRRAKKVLSPSAKYEIWLQLVRGGPFPVWWTLVRFAVPDRVKGS